MPDDLLYAPPAHVSDFDESVDPPKLKQAWHNRVRDNIQDQSRSHCPTIRASGPSSMLWAALSRRRRYRGSRFRRRCVHGIPTATKSVGRLRIPCVRQRDSMAPSSTGWATVTSRPWSSGKWARLGLCYRQQDEYCEWFTHIDPQTKRVTRVDFTAENPDYWEELVVNDPDLAVRLYRRYVCEDVELDDLLWQHDVVVKGDKQPGGVRPSRAVQPAQQMEHDTRGDALDASGEQPVRRDRSYLSHGAAPGTRRPSVHGDIALVLCRIRWCTAIQ